MENLSEHIVKNEEEVKGKRKHKAEEDLGHHCDISINVDDHFMHLLNFIFNTQSKQSYVGLSYIYELLHSEGSTALLL